MMCGGTDLILLDQILTKSFSGRNDRLSLDVPCKKDQVDEGGFRDGLFYLLKAKTSQSEQLDFCPGSFKQVLGVSLGICL